MGASYHGPVQFSVFLSGIRIGTRLSYPLDWVSPFVLSISQGTATTSAHAHDDQDRGAVPSCHPGGSICSICCKAVFSPNHFPELVCLLVRAGVLLLREYYNHLEHMLLPNSGRFGLADSVLGHIYGT